MSDAKASPSSSRPSAPHSPSFYAEETQPIGHSGCKVRTEMTDSPKMRDPFPLAVVTLALTTVGCGAFNGNDSGSPTAPSGAPAAGSTIVYSAVGASDVLGIGSTKPCFLLEDCDGTGYIWVAASPAPLAGIHGERRKPGDSGSSNRPRVPGTSARRTAAPSAATILIDQEMPLVRSNATLVTVFTGGNDVNTITAALGNGAGGSNPTAYIDDKVTAFGNNLTTLIAGIRSARAPRASSSSTCRTWRRYPISRQHRSLKSRRLNASRCA
ncbi:MAG: hypothetical protein QM736_01485 [Vicinamibacterales bacterium]